MPQTLRLAVSQSHTLSTTPLTLSALERTVRRAASQSIDLILFPEAYLGGYPRTATFGGTIGARHPEDREAFLHYFKDAVDLGDTPEGAGQRWVDRELEVSRDGVRGDGTREELERIATETGVFVVTGVVERCAGTLYCGVLYVCPRLGVIGKRRKVMPTGGERLIWGQGQPSSLRALTTTIRGVKLTLAAAICWENYMPLLRHSLYSQNVNLYLAPTADGRDTWLPLMRTIASEGRCFVLSANQCMRKSNLPSWIIGKGKEATSNGTNGHHLPSPTGRARSVMTEEAHDIASKSDTESVADEQPQRKLRRQSTITVDGHEIVLPAPKDEQGDENQARRKLRRKSTVTDDGHEIILPDLREGVGGTKEARNKLRRNSTITADGHEIVFPCSKREEAFQEQPDETKTDSSELVSRGGSCIVAPLGQVLAGPLWDVEEGLLAVDVDFDDVLRGRLDLDVGGSYSRNDSFRLTVEGLDLSPPP